MVVIINRTIKIYGKYGNLYFNYICSTIICINRLGYNQLLFRKEYRHRDKRIECIDQGSKILTGNCIR